MHGSSPRFTQPELDESERVVDAKELVVEEEIQPTDAATPETKEEDISGLEAVPAAHIDPIVEETVSAPEPVDEEVEAEFPEEEVTSESFIVESFDTLPSAEAEPATVRPTSKLMIMPLIDFPLG